MTNLILPKTYIENIDFPIIFLAGPIKGAGGWQNKAIELIHFNDPKIYIASPNIDLKPEYLQNRARSDSPNFPYQLNFERYCLKKAIENGAIMFWLPNQKEAMPINPHTGFPQSYARDTRPETAGWGWKILENDPTAKIVLGGEEYFDGLDVIKRNFLAIKPNMKFYSTLEETCNQAIRLAKGEIQ